MTKLNSKTIGNKAEDAASNWLVKNGFGILARNWQVHGECEIDIVAIKDDVLFFVEVKFRKNDLYGDGLEYIDDQKLEQMELAAEKFLELEPKYEDYDWRLAGLSLSGTDPKVEEFVELD
ncbi:MAG TPA: YraN family protein [Candidatus Saccharibacteria bacterium]|nr:YraN family protein [Candidatus Saccharibacteria bacterium]